MTGAVSGIIQKSGLNQSEVDARVVAVAPTIYQPAMMQFDGTGDYYGRTNVTVTGNENTLIARFAVVSHSGGGSEQIVNSQGSTNYARGILIYGRNDHAAADYRNRIRIEVQNSAGTVICRLFAPSGEYIDGEPHGVFFSFNGTTGAATFIIDGESVDDTGNASRVAPTTGTLDAGASSDFGVAASDGGTAPFTGNVGFVGFRNAYLTNWDDFFEADGSPKDIDTVSWAEWGAQPQVFNPHGRPDNNLGSVGNFTKNGDPKLWLAGFGSGVGIQEP